MNLFVNGLQIPTFVLGISTLFPHLRNNALFAVAFFSTRISLHVILAVSYFSKENRIHATGGSVIPATILAVIFPLHVSWFIACIKGFIRRASQKQATTHPIPVIVPDTRTIPASPDSIIVTVQPSGMTHFTRRVPSRLRNSLSLKLLHRRQSFERIFRSFRPASRSAKEWIFSSAIFGLLPPREVLFHYVGLGRDRKPNPLTPAVEKAEESTISAVEQQADITT
jgi:hypothetical protein